MVRLPSQDPAFVMRVLDAGSMGLVVPHVESGAEAEAVVAAATYRTGDQPGSRGACPGSRAAWHQAKDWPAFVEWSNENVMIWPLVETLKGIENFEEIVSVAGVDAIGLGPFDLAQDMGYDGDTERPEVRAKIEEVKRIALERSVPVVANLFAKGAEALTEEARLRIAEGATILSIGSDRRLISNAMAAGVSALQAAQGEVASAPELVRR
jgi:4-hydroxy-2-oxoheptanedioate aldolase